MKERGHSIGTASVLAFGLIVLMVCVPIAIAKPGALDPSFGDNGRLISDLAFQGPGMEHSSFAMDSNGDMYVVAARHGHGVSRLIPDGSWDESFGGGDGVRDDLVAGSDETWQQLVGVQPDGDLVTACQYYSHPNSGDACLSISDPDEPELTNVVPLGAFGPGGHQPLDLAVARDGGVAVSADGSAGATIARFNADGSRDQRFGDDGRRLFTRKKSGLFGNIALDLHGRVLVIGSRGIRRLRLDGTRDSDFDGRFPGCGLRASARPGSNCLRCGWENLTVDPKGRIIASGSVLRGGHSVSGYACLGRYRPNGKLDRAFSQDGFTKLHYANRFKRPNDIGPLAIQGSRRVFLGLRHIGNGKSSDGFWVAALDAHGRLDRSFGNSGWVKTDFQAPTFLGAMAVRPGGPLVAGGSRSGIFVGAAYQTG